MYTYWHIDIFESNLIAGHTPCAYHCVSAYCILIMIPHDHRFDLKMITSKQFPPFSTESRPWEHESSCFYAWYVIQFSDQILQETSGTRLCGGGRTRDAGSRATSGAGSGGFCADGTCEGCSGGVCQSGLLKWQKRTKHCVKIHANSMHDTFT